MASCGCQQTNRDTHTHTHTHTHTQHTARKFDKRVIRQERENGRPTTIHTHQLFHHHFRFGSQVFCAYPQKTMEEEREHCDDDVENFQVILLIYVSSRFFVCLFCRHTKHTKENDIINDIFTCVFVCVVLCPGCEDRDNTVTGRHWSAPLFFLTKDGRMFVYYRKKGAGPNSPFFPRLPLRAFDPKPIGQ